MSERRTIMFHFALHATVRIVGQYAALTVRSRRYVETSTRTWQEYALAPAGDDSTPLAWHSGADLVQVAP